MPNMKVENYDYEPDFSDDDQTFDNEDYIPPMLLDLEDFEENRGLFIISDDYLKSKRECKAPTPFNMKSRKFYQKRYEDIANSKIEKIVYNPVVHEGPTPAFVLCKDENDENDEKDEKDQKQDVKDDKDVFVRTRLCKSVMKKGIYKPSKKCDLYGDKCRFAHNLSELTLVECSFGDRCRNVNVTKSGVWSKPVKGKNCMFIHKGEPKSQYYKRIGIKFDFTPKQVKMVNKTTFVKVIPSTHKFVKRNTVKKFGTVIKLSDFFTGLNTPKTKKSKKIVNKKPMDFKSIVSNVAVNPTPKPNPKHNNKGWKKVNKNKTRKERKANKKNTDIKNTKNAICKHFKYCNLGNSCRFAHSMAELKKCRFGHECRHVIKNKSRFINNPKSSRKCTFDHGEKLNECYMRIHKC